MKKFLQLISGLTLIFILGLTAVNALKIQDATNYPVGSGGYLPAAITSGTGYIDGNIAIQDLINRSNQTGTMSVDYLTPGITNAVLTNEKLYRLDHLRSTSLLTGGLVTTGSTVTFDISAGVGQVCDQYSDPLTPDCATVNFGSFTGQTPAYFAYGATYLSISRTGALVQAPLAPTSKFTKDHIILGALVHNDLASITGISEFSGPASGELGINLSELNFAIGIINIEGNEYSGNGANLNLDLSAGTGFFFGANKNNLEDRNRIYTPAQTGIAFFRTYQDAGNSWLIDVATTIPVAEYDAPGVSTGVVQSWQYTFSKLYYAPGSRTTVLKMGQEVYASQSEALQHLTNDVTRPPLAKDLQFRGWIVTKGNATACEDGSGNANTDQCLFITAGNLGQEDIAPSKLQDGVVNMHNFGNGSIIYEQRVTVRQSGSTVWADIDKLGSGDLVVQFEGINTIVDTSPPISVQLTVGSDISPQDNYIYITTGGVITVTATDPDNITFSHAPVAKLQIPSATTLGAFGSYGFYIYNTAMGNGIGGRHKLIDWVSDHFPYYKTGVSGTVSIDTATSPDNVYLSTTAGTIRLYDLVNFSLFATGSTMIVPNHPATGNLAITKLNDITIDTTSTTLSATTYNLIVGGVYTNDGGYLFVNTPRGSYPTNTQGVLDASNDVNSTAITTCPDGTEGSCFLIARYTIKWLSTGGGQLTLEATEDLRGVLPGSQAGSGGGNVKNNYADNEFTIYNAVTAAKIAIFSAVDLAVGSTSINLQSLYLMITAGLQNLIGTQTGSLAVSNGTTYTGLTIGTSGQILTALQSGMPAWLTPEAGGGLTYGTSISGTSGTGVEINAGAGSATGTVLYNAQLNNAQSGAVIGYRFNSGTGNVEHAAIETSGKKQYIKIGDSEALEAGTGNKLYALNSDLLWSNKSIVTDLTAGISWTDQLTGIATASWQGLTYGNGLFVAVNNGHASTRVATSPDGFTWTYRTASELSGWNAVTYGNGLFVAVASSGTGLVMTSTNGINWTSRTAALVAQWKSVTYGDGLFVSTSQDGKIMTSPDGIIWTQRTAPEPNSWNIVKYGGGKYVSIASSGTGRTMYSTDGIIWTLGSPTNVNANVWYSLAYGNGKFVMGSITGTNRLLYSTDGINWSVSTDPGSSQYWSTGTFGNGTFAFASASGGTYRVITSTDGISWTANDLQANPSDWWSSAYGNGMFVFLNQTTSVMTSGRNINWGGGSRGGKGVGITLQPVSGALGGYALSVPNSSTAPTNAWYYGLLGNTQSAAHTMAKFDLGTSAQANIGVHILPTGASDNTIGLKIDSLTGGKGTQIQLLSTNNTSNTGPSYGINIDWSNNLGAGTPIRIIMGQTNQNVYAIAGSFANGFAAVRTGFISLSSTASQNLGSIARETPLFNLTSSYTHTYHSATSSWTSGMMLMSQTIGLSDAGGTFNENGYNLKLNWNSAYTVGTINDTHRILEITGAGTKWNGNAISFSGATAGSTFINRTDSYLNYYYKRDNTKTSTVLSDNFDFQYIKRENTQSGSGGTFSAQGTVAKFENASNYSTGGTMQDGVNVLSLVQSILSTGALITATGSGNEVFRVGQRGAMIKTTTDLCISGKVEAGALYYNQTSNYFCFCDGTGTGAKMHDVANDCF